MSHFLGVIKKYNHVTIETMVDDWKARRDPDFFWPTGTQMYVGRQGSGKTISAVKHVLDLKKRYPKCKIVSNIELNVPFSYKFFKTMHELEKLLVSENNGKYGVIYLIDEIHTYFNALESKNIPMYVFTEISQQRKQRKLIIGTSQLFLRAAKPLREQCDNLVVCTTYLGVFTVQQAYDGMTLDQDYNGKLIGSRKKVGWFVHKRSLREAFDTYQKVVSGAEQYESVQKMEVNLKKK